MMSGTFVLVDEFPECDICAASGKEVPAAYDAKTFEGPWAYLCVSHWNTDAKYQWLGTGAGQELRLKSSE